MRPMLGALARINIFTTALAIFMTIIVIAGLSARSRDSRTRLGWDSVSLIISAIAGYYIIFRFG